MRRGADGAEHEDCERGAYTGCVRACELRHPVTKWQEVQERDGLSARRVCSVRGGGLGVIVGVQTRTRIAFFLEIFFPRQGLRYFCCWWMTLTDDSNEKRGRCSDGRHRPSRSTTRTTVARRAEHERFLACKKIDVKKDGRSVGSSSLISLTRCCHMPFGGCCAKDIPHWVTSTWRKKPPI